MLAQRTPFDEKARSNDYQTALLVSRHRSKSRRNRRAAAKLRMRADQSPIRTYEADMMLCVKSGRSAAPKSSSSR
jgi:hypothetical protein